MYEKSLASHRYVVGKGGIFNILFQIIFFDTALKMDKYVQVFSFFLIKNYFQDYDIVGCSTRITQVSAPRFSRS